MRSGYRAMVSALVVAAAGCSAETDRTVAPSSGPDCVKIPEGYYIFEDGQFTRAPDLARVSAAGVDRASPPPRNWAADVRRELSAAGHDWLGLQVKRGVVATFYGDAPTATARAAGLSEGRAAIAADPLADRTVAVIVNAASAPGRTGPGAAVAALDEYPSAAACEAAFAEVAGGEAFAFVEGTDPGAAERDLLAAVAGIAIVCQDHDIEIGGHWSAPGGEAASQRRAEAVKTRLTELGAFDDRLTAVGYGDSRPIDRSITLVDAGANERIEFSVSER